MFRYFQRSEEGGWTPVTDSHDVEDRVKAENGRKMTILAVSHAVNEETDREALSYKGPLYFDIDYKGDITEAIRSAKDLCRTLVERYEVPKEAIWPFCSGSKGIHILIPETVFSSGRAMKQLPLVYKEMARQLSVVGLDFQVYSTGRGNSFRLANLQRADGNYRVPITYEELFALTGDRPIAFPYTKLMVANASVNPGRRVHRHQPSKSQGGGRGRDAARLYRARRGRARAR